ncbi:hypothetical protein [Streptomyces sp. NPDC007074]|uniref:hypothetical protein n=1 Tax=Streptomyces sp. NPDC007074 TaxID=3156764 RepID=UPI0033EF2B7B
MGMSTRIKGFAPPDERWQQMKTIWDACRAAHIDPPADVERFFDGAEPNPHGQEVDIPHREWQDDHRQGVEIQTDDIPENVKVIRFYNSW